jgi:predicted nucleic acid-binding protein
MRAFSIMVPGGVETEILATDERYPQRLYPDTALFIQIRGQFLRPPEPEPAPLERFGAGEAAAIALSRSTGGTLLINDRRPAELARNLGLAVVSCPGMIVIARSQQLIPSHMAHAMLRMCGQHGTAPSIVQEASILLTSLDGS